MKYFGYIIDENEVSPNENVVKVVKEIQIPKEWVAKGVRDITTPLQIYIPNFSNQAKRMICQLRKKDDTIKWTDKMTKELENIRNQLKGNPKLYYPSFDNEFSLYSDASAWGLVWYLTQGNGKHEHIITIVYIGVSPPPPPP